MYMCWCIWPSRPGTIISVTCEGSEFGTSKGVLFIYYNKAKVGYVCFA